jgi:hypothetical protein
MTLLEFEQTVATVAAMSPLCGIPVVRRLMPTSIVLRVPIVGGRFVEAFFNEATGTTAYALIQEGRRVFGADNTGGRWHLHPFEDPEGHHPWPGEISFAEFIAEVERHG